MVLNVQLNIFRLTKRGFSLKIKMGCMKPTIWNVWHACFLYCLLCKVKKKDFYGDLNKRLFHKNTSSLSHATVKDIHHDECLLKKTAGQCVIHSNLTLVGPCQDLFFSNEYLQQQFDVWFKINDSVCVYRHEKHVSRGYFQSSPRKTLNVTSGIL